MAQQYPGLVLNNRVYYFRLGVPRRFRTLARCKDICYSLNTSNFTVALGRWRTELAHVQKFFNVFEEVIMKISENNHVILTDIDSDKILIYRLGQIQHFIETKATEIEEGTKGVKDIQLYDPEDKRNTPDKIKDLMVDMIYDYLKRLIDSNQANVTLRSIYSKLRNKEVSLGLTERNETGDEWFKTFSTHVHALEKYAAHAVKSIKKDRPYSPSNPKVKNLLSTYDSVKTTEQMRKSMTSTPWRKFFKRFALMKQNRKGVGRDRLQKAERYIQLCFLLMKRDFVEDVTKQDCRKLSELIYRVPKRWKDKLQDGMLISSIFTDSPKKALSKPTIQYYLTTFKEYMRYAEKEEIIDNSLNLFVDPPIKVNTLSREPFTSDELRKIFNPDTYITPKCRKNIAKFWVPIIALYHGCRLNEICQMDLDDIVIQKQIPCFSINHNTPDKSTKNEGSVRIIPIHPQLIEMGFMDYIEYQRRNNKKKVFSELKRIKNGMYGRPVQSWFARYLDSLGITEKSKVFHSFRHTFETQAVDCRIPTEYQNALGGWVDYGTGQRVYARKKDIRIMYDELSKISYPIKREISGLTEMFHSCYVYRFLEDC